MKETWISVDLEASGAVPGLYDLVSIGATVIIQDELRRQELIHEQRTIVRPTFYVELQPHGGMLDPDAMAVHKITTEHLRENGVDPKIAVTRFVDWVKGVVDDTRPVFCSWGTFDWMWMGYYLEKFGRKYVMPFGPNSLDLKSFYLGLTKGKEWRVTAKSRMPKDDLCGKHTHNALDDALEQAEMIEGWIEKYAGPVRSYNPRPPAPETV